MLGKAHGGISTRVKYSHSVMLHIRLSLQINFPCIELMCRMFPFVAKLEIFRFELQISSDSYIEEVLTRLWC